MSGLEIRNARLLDQEGLWTILLSGDRIASIEPQPPFSAPAPSEWGAVDDRVVDAGGGLTTPCLVDAHLHLDLAYSLELVPENRSGTLLEAIALWSQAKSDLSVENVCDRASRAIHAELLGGTGLIRSHVDVASSAELRLCEGVLAARERTSELCRVDLVAFPQDGLICDPGAVEQVREAMRLGVDLVGGIPHIERTREDGLRHLRMVFDIAADFDADIDVHIDETDDPNSQYTEQLAALAIERQWQGRVTASHVCALASYDEAHASRVMDLLAAARVKVVTNPGVNLHLQGRFDRYPVRRGLTRVRDLLARGVLCAAGQDCIRDPFYPFGNGRMLDQAFLLAHAEHMTQPHQIRQAFAMVCGMAGRLFGADRHKLLPGAAANLAVFPAADVHELVRLRPTPRLVLHKGRDALLGIAPVRPEYQI